LTLVNILSFSCLLFNRTFYNFLGYLWLTQRSGLIVIWLLLRLEDLCNWLWFVRMRHWQLHDGFSWLSHRVFQLVESSFWRLLFDFWSIRYNLFGGDLLSFDLFKLSLLSLNFCSLKLLWLNLLSLNFFEILLDLLRSLFDCFGWFEIFLLLIVNLVSVIVADNLLLQVERSD